MGGREGGEQRRVGDIGSEPPDTADRSDRLRRDAHARGFTDGGRGEKRRTTEGNT